MINCGCTASKCWLRDGVSTGLATIKFLSSPHWARAVGVRICPLPDFLSGVEIIDASECSEAIIASMTGIASKDDEATEICKIT